MKIKFSRKKKRQIYLAVGGSLAILVLFYFYASFVLQKLFVQSYTQSPATQKPCENQRLLDGVCVKRDKVALVPFAAMIDNSSDARPAYGIENASIVYESIVESGITRYLVIFDSSVDAKKIGPIRSVRPYYIDWASEWDTILFHSGGSPQALTLLRSEQPVRDVNEISGDGIFYFRDRTIQAPHNLFTSSKLMSEATETKQFETEAEFLPWKFLQMPAQPSVNDGASKLTVNFSGEDYEVSYLYDMKKNSYQRFLGQKPHITGSRNEIWTSNVIVHYTDAKVIDELARLNVTTTGKGDAKIYLNNQEIEGFWQTKNRRTRYYDLSGEEIEFVPGPIWVEIVFGAVEVSYLQQTDQ